MRRKESKHLLAETWAFVAIAVIAFVGGLLIGDLGGSPKSETVYVSSAEATEAEEAASAAEPEPEASSGSPSSQLFTSAGCGSCHTLAAAGSTGTTGPDLEETLAPDDTAGIEEMILNPNEEVVEGYPANVMPQTYGQSLSKAEVHQLAEFLVESTPAKPNP